MNDTCKNWVVVVVMAVLCFGLSAWCILKPADAYSQTERRPLAQFPDSQEDFSSEFESYSADQFPLRERFRKLYAAFRFYGLGQLDVNDIYLAEDYAAKLEYPLNTDSVDWALSRFQKIADLYLTGQSAYVAVVPDKGYFLAEKHSYPAMDYEALFEAVREGTESFATYLDLPQQLSLDQYYRTDTHWRQETLADTAAWLGQQMGVTVKQDYTKQELDQPFYGVYYGQAALPMEPDTLCYLTNDTLNQLQAVSYDTGKPESIPLYDMEKAHGKDGYELFLSGPLSLITITNPSAANSRELIVFRDSFGSSIAPLLASGYRKVTLVDIRYLAPSMVGRFVDFENADILFLYSTLVLNNSEGQLLP